MVFFFIFVFNSYKKKLEDLSAVKGIEAYSTVQELLQDFTKFRNKYVSNKILDFFDPNEYFHFNH